MIRKASLFFVWAGWMGALLAATDAASPPETRAEAPSAETSKTAPAGTPGEPAMSFSLTSTAFNQGETIPITYTGDGQDVSPPLQWANPPEGVQSFALICDDPDAPVGVWVHWVIYNIPAEKRVLPQGMPQTKQLDDGTRQGINDSRKIGYNGPAPPPGKVHRYFFKLYALDAPVSLAPGATKQQLLDATKGHVLGEAELMGKYKR